MGIAELQAYGYLAVVVFLTVGLYAYIYHLYKNRKYLYVFLQKNVFIVPFFQYFGRNM